MFRPRLRTLLLLVCATGATRCAPDRFLSVDTGVAEDLRGLTALGPDRMVAVGAQGRILVWDGAAFTDTSSDADPGPRVANYFGVTSLDGDALVVGDNGTVLRQDGPDFLRENTRTDLRLRTAVRATPSLVYAAGDGGRVITRTRADDRWDRVNVGAGDAIVTAAWAQSAAAVVFATDQGTIIERDGDDWVTQVVTTETSSVPVPLFGVWSATVGADLLAVGLAGGVFRRAAGETTWTEEDVPPVQDLYAIWGRAEDDVYVVGARGTILHFDGLGWAAVPSSVSRDLFAIVGTPTQILAVGEAGVATLLE